MDEGQRYYKVRYEVRTEMIVAAADAEAAEEMFWDDHTIAILMAEDANADIEVYSVDPLEPESD